MAGHVDQDGDTGRLRQHGEHWWRSKVKVWRVEARGQVERGHKAVRSKVGMRFDESLDSFNKSDAICECGLEVEMGGKGGKDEGKSAGFDERS